ncbi:TetR/AcrR family transcriptional regulator [Sphingomonas sp. HT-1]|jgi:AcrR family transcriptional regulator|uniref:TetR/AcrR family transcriptional regulator n=1 Tax=unclassified Sphingomonas TaxID=196159 RepID=UPI0002D57482|nr:MULTISPECIES: TetR/AcrR family transcriptional regulator [unclassified Sphingomonas]KTF68263.1 TetR family transcriptional regulator [Sphingomonas sp. WG]
MKLGNDDDIPDTRARILAAAAQLVLAGGVPALTTRAVAAAASVQAPTIYRLFGDKRGLLDAVAEHGLAAFVASKRQVAPHPDPVENLREAWGAYVKFGVANPAVFAIMSEVGRAGPPSPAMLAGMDILRARVERIARAGRLRVPVERAVALIHAAGTGIIATLLASPAADRDPFLAPLALEACLAVLVEEPTRSAAEPRGLAIGLRAHLNAVAHLSPGERLLLGELLDRLSTDAGEPG